MAEPATLVLLTTAAYDELATKLRKLDRFDAINAAEDCITLGDIVLMRLVPRPAVVLPQR